MIEIKAVIFVFIDRKICLLIAKYTALVELMQSCNDCVEYLSEICQLYCLSFPELALIAEKISLSVKNFLRLLATVSSYHCHATV